MDTKKQIVEHDAFVREVKNGKIIVDVLAKSACLSCQLRGVCSVSDLKEKAVEVVVPKDLKFDKGEKVTVYLSEKQGLMAVFWGYVLPFVLVMATLVSVLQFTDNQGVAGLLALAVLIPYYFILYLFRKKISDRYKFKLK